MNFMSLVIQHALSVDLLMRYDAGEIEAPFVTERFLVTPPRLDPPTIPLTVDDILDVRLSLFGDDPSKKLRDRGLLEAAVNRSIIIRHYDDTADIADAAAVLMASISETQPFVDGNKRIGLMSGLLLLALNGYRSTALPESEAQWMIDLSEHRSIAPHIRALTVYWKGRPWVS